MLKPKIEAVCHSMIFMLGTAVGIFACHTDLNGIVQFKHLAFALVATVMFSLTQFMGLFSKKSR